MRSSWNLPPGCTPGDIERAAGAYDPECMECGLPVRDSDEAIREPGEPATRHCPGAAPYIAHVSCPPRCDGCAEPFDDRKVYELGKLKLCDYCYDTASIAKGAHDSGVSLSSEFKDGGPPYERRED